MHIKRNKLYFSKISAESLVKKYGSPLYVYELETVKKRYCDLIQSIRHPNLAIHYACKANSNPAILKFIKKLGAGLEAVSVQEIQAGMAAGFKPSQIIFTCSNLGLNELKFIIAQQITINLDSLSQLEKYGRLAPGGKISLRLNIDIGGGHHDHVITGGPNSKFGIHYSQIAQAQAIAKKYKLKITGLHQHVGSNILDSQIFMAAMQALIKVAEKIRDLEFIDFGGGFGIPYAPDQKPLNLKILGRKIAAFFNEFCQSYGRELKLVFEPGRYLVGEAGVLLCTVTDVKTNPHRTFVGVDTGFNHLIRPTMYGSYHEIINASRVLGKKEKVTVAGNLCESGDILGKDRKITAGREGDILAILNAGAYGFAMSSNYNLRPKANELIIAKNHVPYLMPAKNRLTPVLLTY